MSEEKPNGKAVNRESFEKILVLSSERKLSSLVKFSLESSFCFNVTCVLEKNQFIDKIKEGGYCLVIYNYVPENYLIDDIIKCTSGAEKQIPVVILADKKVESKRSHNNYTIFLPKEKAIKGLNELVHTLFKRDDSHSSDDFCRVSLDSMDIFDGLSNDLYIQLKSGRFVKLFQEGDELGPDDISKYQSKGVEYLFLKQKTCMWVIQQIDSQIDLFLKNRQYKFILRSPDSPDTKKFEQKIIRIQDELLVTEDYKKEIEVRVAKAVEVIKRNPKLKKPLSLLKLKNPTADYFNTHTSLLIITSCGLAKLMGWNSDITLEKLVYASILHDITLAGKPHLSEIESLEDLAVSNLSKEDQKIFISHPQDVSNLIKNAFGLAPADTDIIVYQHHELPDGKGFPKGITSGRIIPLSALFIISHELVRYTWTNKDLDMDDFLLKAEKKFHSINFNKILSILKKESKKKAS